MTMLIAIAAYAAAMILANLSVAAFGPWVSPINAFVLIGLDLALRDWLHVRLRVWQMGVLIAGTGALTYALNPAAGMIAIASSAAFTAAAVVDWATFAANCASTICGISAPKASVGNTSESTAAPATLDPLARNIQLPRRRAKIAQSTTAAAVNAADDAMAIMPAAGLSA